MLDILATNRDLNVDIREELAMLTIEVEKLATYQMGLDKGMEAGIEKGMETGLERGIERGIEKGAKAQSLAIAKNLLDCGTAIEVIVLATATIA